MALPSPRAGAAALVTGSSSGIGVELARALARRGHGLVLVARRRDRLDSLAAELSERHGVRAEVLAADLADDGARTRMLAELAELELEIDVLVNNAGFGSAGPFQDLDPGREAEMVRLNCEVVVALCGRFVPAMVQAGRGAVLNVASTAGFQPLPRQATYGASKAFVLSFSEALRTDVRAAGVAVTALCPGPVRTEFADVAGLGDLAERAPEFVWVTAEDVAEAGIRGLERGKRVVVPGPLNRLTALGGQHAPRGALLALADRFYPFGK